MRIATGRLAAVHPSPLFLMLIGLTAFTGVLLATSPPDGAVRMLTIIFILSGWLVSVCVHEFGHALAGYLGGDQGVVYRGGLTLDPRYYTDPLLSIVLPIVFLVMGGFALPGGSVMVNDRVLRSRRWELAVSAGGPVGTLLVLALAAGPFLLGAERWITAENYYFWSALAGLAQILAISLVFNLLPIPPLDGFRILSHWMTYEARYIGLSLGFAPLLVFYLVMSQPSPLRDAFWDFNWTFGEMLHIPIYDAWWAMTQLSLW